MKITTLEQSTFSEDFRMVLLLADVNPATNQLAFTVREYEGGVCTHEERIRAFYSAGDSGPYDLLRRFVTSVSAAPHVLVVAGHGWQDLLTAFLPQPLLDALRILDLRESLSAYAPEIKISLFPEGFATHFGLAWRAAEADLPIDLVEHLMWHLIHLAGSAGLTWVDLLNVAHTSRQVAPFDRFSFDPQVLAMLPNGPGVYIMYDPAGQPIYVGKAHSLQQRVSGYFTSRKTVPEKLQRLWDQLDALEVRPVGSELEALLLEQALIQELTPRVNVQRQIAEGRGRYGSPAGTVVLLCGSAKAGHQELFWIGLADSTYQLRINPKRPPVRQLKVMQSAALSNGSPRKLSVHFKDWGPTGNEIASRYFGRFRHRLTWLESGALSVSDFVERLKPLLQQTMTSDPAEIRMHDWQE